MKTPDRSLTPPLGLAACGWCGGEAIPIPNTAVPRREQLHGHPWNKHCITSPRWRWCWRTDFFCCWYGPGEPPESIPGVSLSAVPDGYMKGPRT
jgi:hypothetical protein